MRDKHTYHLVSITGHFLTVNNTWTKDPTKALKAERWWLEYAQQKINTMTVIIRALTPAT